MRKSPPSGRGGAPFPRSPPRRQRAAYTRESVERACECARAENSEKGVLPTPPPPPLSYTFTADGATYNYVVDGRFAFLAVSDEG